MSNFKTITKPGITLQVYTAPESSFGVTSTIISAQKDAVLVDAQFNLSDAKIIAEEIKNSGKNLIAVLITHGDPDYYFGLEAIKHYFPQVIVYATEEIVEHIKATSQKKLNVWADKLGANGTKNVILPQVLTTNKIQLEQHELIITGGVAGRIFISIPTIQTVLGGINVFGTGLHPWLADSSTEELRNAWIQALNEIENLAPETVIPAHSKAESELNLNSVRHVKDYLVKYDLAVKDSQNSDELIAKMQELFPAATFNLALQIGAKVTMGEMKW